MAQASHNNMIKANTILPANRQIVEYNGQSVFVYVVLNPQTNQHEQKFITRDMFTHLAGGQPGCPPIIKLIERGGNVNIGFYHIWVEYPNGMIHWRVGELLNGKSFEEINWKLYHQEPGVKNKGIGSQSDYNQQGLYQAAERWVKALEQKGYKLFFPSDEIVGNQLYFLRSNNTDILTGDFEIPECMLAKDFNEKRLPPDPVIVQPKYDGKRNLLLKKNEQIISASRGKKMARELPHIHKQGEILFEVIQEKANDKGASCKYALDGELFNPNFNFQQIISAVQRSVNENHMSKQMSYIVYDLIDDGKVSQLHRLQFLQDVFNDPRVAVLENIKLSAWYYVNKENIGELQKRFEDAGLEGAMIRDPNAVYQGKRVWSLMKLKTWSNEEAWIIGAEEATGTHQGCVVWVLNSKADGTGVTYKANPVGDGLGDLESRKRQMENWRMFLGTMVTIKYFGKSTSGTPRFPAVIGFNRNDL